MVRNYKRKTENTRWSENDLQAAIKGIKNKAITFSKATELYKIPRSTLFRHVRNKVSINQSINLFICFVLQNEKYTNICEKKFSKAQEGSEMTIQSSSQLPPSK